MVGVLVLSNTLNTTSRRKARQSYTDAFSRSFLHGNRAVVVTACDWPAGTAGVPIPVSHHGKFGDNSSNSTASRVNPWMFIGDPTPSLYAQLSGLGSVFSEVGKPFLT